MILPEKSSHPTGEKDISLKKRELATLIAETLDGKIHIEWDPPAQVTPLGQLSFFIQYLKIGYLFEPWVNECPLKYESNNAPKKVNVLGSLLSGHTGYAHITRLMDDSVNAKLPEMSKVVSDDCVRRALNRIDEDNGVRWLQDHLYRCYSPLLSRPWILDTDVTVKPL